MASQERSGLRGGRLWRLARRWGPPIGLVLLVRAVLLLVSLFAYEVNTNRGLGSYQEFLEIWKRWDASNFLFIAERGYVNYGDEANYIVFLPLYPAVTRLMAALTGDYLLAGMAVSLAASLVAAVLLYELVRLDFDGATATRAVWFMSVFPTAYFLVAPYTEATYLALTLAAFYGARRGSCAWAGLWGALALLTRGLGAATIPSLVVEFQRGGWRPTWRLLWLGFFPLAGLLYVGLNYAVFNDPLAFTQRLQEHWFKSPAWPWQGIYSTYVAHQWRPPGETMLVVWAELAFVGLVVAAGLVAWRWVRPSYGLYLLATWLLMTSTGYILSSPRYALGLFPIFILMARLARGELWGYGLSALSLTALAYLTTRFTLGQWAF